MSNAAHRGLSLTSPAPRGSDVERLQTQINRAYRHFHIDRRIAEDGEFGPNTLSAAKQIALCEGITGKARRKLKRGIVSIRTQRLIRGGRVKTAREILLTKTRTRYRKKLRKRYAAAPGEKAVARAQKWLGTTEVPPGSNWGGEVEKFIRYTGYNGPVYWCGCWAAWVVCKLGGAKIPSRIRLGYAPYITSDAQNGANGLRSVSPAEARPGDIGTLWNGEHIAVIAGTARDGYIETIEGNTSPPSGSGSQSNGGGVYARVRPVADFDCFARPDYR